MGLTSGAFELMMIAGAAAALGCVVWAWPAMAGRRARDLAGRAGLIVVSQALVVAAFLTCLNGYFGFFGSWSELVGPGRERPVSAVLAGGAGPGSAAPGSRDKGRPGSACTRSAAAPTAGAPPWPGGC
ncbi:MAG TPA: hypothetical protein VGG25_09435 [Streptosporangiaceae bacterium]|jgi:hypothetical protein